MAKKRTDNKVRNAAISCLRKSFAHYSPTVKVVLEKRRIEVERLKKNGEPHKVPAVFYVCDQCGENHKSNEVDLDHCNPVIPLNKTATEMSLDEIYDNINCDESNLQVLCKTCHKAKSAKERELRKKYKKQKESK